jgi:hypothetical protein
MASNGGRRRRLLTASGILCIVGGAYAVICVVSVMDITIANIELLSWDWVQHPLRCSYAGIIRSLITVASIFALGIVTVVGGVSAMRRKKFGLSLAGAICFALTPPVAFNESFSASFFSKSLAELVWVWGWMIMGILAVIFVVLGKREFRAKGKGNGI